LFLAKTVRPGDGRSRGSKSGRTRSVMITEKNDCDLFYLHERFAGSKLLKIHHVRPTIIIPRLNIVPVYTRRTVSQTHWTRARRRRRRQNIVNSYYCYYEIIIYNINIMFVKHNVNVRRSQNPVCVCMYVCM